MELRDFSQQMEAVGASGLATVFCIRANNEAATKATNASVFNFAVSDRDEAYCYCPNCRETGYILASHMFLTLQELRESSRREDQQMADLIEWNQREFDFKRQVCQEALERD